MRAAEAELAPCLAPMAARLAEPYRSAIQLTSVDGLTQAEAAKRAGISVSGMKSRVQPAREQLKGMLLPCCQATWISVAVSRIISCASLRPAVRQATGRHPSAAGRVAGCSPRQ